MSWLFNKQNKDRTEQNNNEVDEENVIDDGKFKFNFESVIDSISNEFKGNNPLIKHFYVDRDVPSYVIASNHECKNRLYMNKYSLGNKYLDAYDITYGSFISDELLSNDFFDAYELSFSEEDKKKIIKLENSFQFLNDSLCKFNKINPYALEFFNSNDLESMAEEQIKIINKIRERFNNLFIELINVLSNAKTIEDDRKAENDKLYEVIDSADL